MSGVPLLPVVVVLVDVLAGGKQLVKQMGDGCFARAGGARNTDYKRVHGAMSSNTFTCSMLFTFSFPPLVPSSLSACPDRREPRPGTEGGWTGKTRYRQGWPGLTIREGRKKTQLSGTDQIQMGEQSPRRCSKIGILL